MTRLLFRAIDFGASVVFMALCAKAFCVHFYKDVERQLGRRKLPVVDGPSLVPTVVPKPAQAASRVRESSRSFVKKGQEHSRIENSSLISTHRVLNLPAKGDQRLQ
jgi:hypothetical protein